MKNILIKFILLFLFVSFCFYNILYAKNAISNVKQHSDWITATMTQNDYSYNVAMVNTTDDSGFDTGLKIIKKNDVILIQMVKEVGYEGVSLIGNYEIDMDFVPIVDNIELPKITFTLIADSDTGISYTSKPLINSEKFINALKKGNVLKMKSSMNGRIIGRFSLKGATSAINTIFK